MIIDRHGPRPDASLSLGSLTEQNLIDVFSPLQMSLRALVRHFDPRGSTLATDHNGGLYGDLTPFRVEVAPTASGHARMAAGARLDAFWCAHPELGTLEALGVPERELLSLPEILLSVLETTPLTAIELLPRVVAFGYADGASHVAWILDQLALAGFADYVGMPGQRAQAYLAPENVAELRWVRGARWQEGIQRLLGGTIFT